MTDSQCTADSEGHGLFSLRPPNFSNAETAAEYKKILSTSTLAQPSTIDKPFVLPPIEETEEPSLQSEPHSVSSTTSNLQQKHAEHADTQPKTEQEAFLSEFHEPEFSQQPASLIEQPEKKPQQQERNEECESKPITDKKKVEQIPSSTVPIPQSTQQSTVPLHLSLPSLDDCDDELSVVIIDEEKQKEGETDHLKLEEPKLITSQQHEDEDEGWTKVTKDETAKSTPKETGTYLVVTTATMPLVKNDHVYSTQQQTQTQENQMTVESQSQTQQQSTVAGWQYKRAQNASSDIEETTTQTKTTSSPTKTKQPRKRFTPLEVVDVGFRDDESEDGDEKEAMPKKKRKKQPTSPRKKSSNTIKATKKQEESKKKTEEQTNKQQEEDGGVSEELEESVSWIDDDESENGSEPWRPSDNDDEEEKEQEQEKEHTQDREEEEEEQSLSSTLSNGAINSGQTEDHWPIYPTNKQSSAIFKGYKFCFTGIDKDTRKRISTCIGKADVLNVSQLYTHVTCGSTKQKKEAKTLLLSSFPVRTIKYLVAISLAVPCVKSDWIFACQEAHGIVPITPFLLQNGTSVSTTDETVPSSGSITPAYPLDGLRVEVLSNIDDWELVLRAAGAKPVRRLFTADESRIDCIISPTPTSSSPAAAESQGILEHAKKLGVPVLTTDWLIQCVTEGRKIDPETLPSKFVVNQ